MPQEFHVLRCFSCETFQVHIVKKSNKWSCKMCGEKQSVKKVFGRGTGKECRLHVQSLNEKRMLMNEANEEDAEDDEDEEVIEEFDESVIPRGSKWSEYLADENATQNEEQENSKYTFERPNKKRKMVNQVVKTPINRLKKSSELQESDDRLFEPSTDIIEPDVKASPNTASSSFSSNQNSKSKWDDFVEDTTEIPLTQNLSTNIFNSGTNIDDLDNILDF